MNAIYQRRGLVRIGYRRLSSWVAQREDQNMKKVVSRSFAYSRTVFECSVREVCFGPRGSELKAGGGLQR